MSLLSSAAFYVVWCAVDRSSATPSLSRKAPLPILNMHAVVKSLATRAAPMGVRSFATVGPGAVLHRAGSANTPSAEWLKETAARKTPFDDYTFAYVCSWRSQRAGCTMREVVVQLAPLRAQNRVMTHSFAVCFSCLC